MFGILTIPKKSYLCILGDRWIDVDYIPSTDYIFGNNCHNYKFCYQMIKQNWLGVWSPIDCYLCKNYKLTEQAT